MNTALLIVDIQNDYFPGGNGELTGSVEAATNAARLLDAARKARWPVIHVQHISTRQGAKIFIPGTPGVEIHKDVQPVTGEKIITKHSPNSFRETGLHDLLRDLHIERLLISGMMSHMCIDATVRSAFDLGFTCTVAHDACATRDLVFNGVSVPARQVHASFMAALSAVYAEVKGTDEILMDLSKA